MHRVLFDDATMLEQLSSVAPPFGSRSMIILRTGSAHVVPPVGRREQPYRSHHATILYFERHSTTEFGCDADEFEFQTA